jgi:hypothetical protein
MLLLPNTVPFTSQVLLEVGKFMPGMVEGIVGAGKGDLRTIEVIFPTRPTGPGAALSGKTALFELEVIDVKVKTLPEWGANLAASIRDGMTLDDLNNEVCFYVFLRFLLDFVVFSSGCAVVLIFIYYIQSLS